MLQRLPPHSVDAEKGVLGCILLAPREGVDASVMAFQGLPTPFYIPAHEILYRTVLEMVNSDQTVDLVTLVARLQDTGKLENIGGFTFLAGLMDGVPSAGNIRYYLDIVREKALLRQAIVVCTQGVSNAYACDGTVEDTLSDIEASVLAIRNTRTLKTARTALDLSRSVVDLLEARHSGKSGRHTGFPDLDRATNGGLQDSEMFVLAARPSCGKTSLALNIAANVAADMAKAAKGEHVAVFSLEMTAEALVERLVASAARVNTRKKSHDEWEMARLTEGIGEVGALPIIIDDSSEITINELRSRARHYYSRNQARLFVIDYLQLVASASGAKADQRRQEVEAISAGIKAMAKELHVPVVVLSQLNRDLEKDKTRKPRLSDLRESGRIEQDADFVGFLYSKKEDDETDPNPIRPVSLLIGKQRNGGRNLDIPLTFFSEFTRFESCAPIEDTDLP